MVRIPDRINARRLIPVALVIVLFLNLTSCGIERGSKSHPIAGAMTPTTKSEEHVKFAGVTFSCPTKLGAIVVPSESEGTLVNNPTDKPDSLRPKNRTFRFQGSYGTKFEGSFFKPELSIFSIDDYRKKLAMTEMGLDDFNNRLSTLRSILRDKRVPTSGVPFLLFIDAEEMLRSHVEYVSFSGGNGLLVLTQYNNEPTLVNNKALTYVFQGLTADQKNYVLATFPVSHHSLAQGSNVRIAGDYELPIVFYSVDRAQRLRNQSRYKTYVQEAQAQLESFSSNEFSPDLDILKQIIVSLKILE